MKTWNILKNSKKNVADNLIDILLENRGIKTKIEKENFLNPLLEGVTVKSVGIDEKELKKAVARIKKALKNQEQMVVFGDYDVDGITGAAIIWETLHEIGGKILPHIPHRIEEGYGLSITGISNIIEKLPEIKLIITVDNGIVANEAVDYANSHGIDVIITDHHVASDHKPKALAIVHTTKLCGAGVGYLLSKELKTKNQEPENDAHLELAALGTVADMVPLTNENRAIVKHGLSKICNTNRKGLQELFRQAGLEKDTFTPYEIGYIIAPRLNAAGRIESGMDSLRLICTNDRTRAKLLAEKLELINKERQLILKEITEHAITSVQSTKTKIRNLLFIAHETYQQGVIGLVAGKLVEEFYRPAIVVSIGKKISKASARSITGFNLIEFLRQHATEFINVGGHPMAAGFSIATEKIESLKKLLEKSADEIITEEILKRALKIDCILDLSLISIELYKEIQSLSPFGIGNPEPTFASYNVTVKDFKLLGKDKTHLKLQIYQEPRTKNQEPRTLEAIAFGMGELAENLKQNNKIDIAYTIDENSWNGNIKLQLKIKDIKINDK
ncbi:MAG TPA: single-stranded-DNA-specific exonuclease RecJ [Candidatus Limnocylindrales bacterium]|nr:single-stranded-DNA-specific exonuclease RecJ [Candidatus Limnocylindrales bacterium]